MKSNSVLIIVLIILLSVISLSLLGIMIIAITGNLPSFEKSNSYELALSEDITKECDFVIESDDCDVKILTYDGDFLGNIKIYNDKENASVKFEGNVCRISSKLKTAPINFNFKTPVVEVYLPSDYSGEISINGDSGDIVAEDFKALTLKVDSDSGDIVTGVIKSAVVDTDSSNVTIKETNSLNAKLDSGNIKIEKINDFADLTLDSGNVSIKQFNVTANSSVKTDSGNINIEKTNNIYIDAKSHTGNMTVGNSDRKADLLLTVISDSGNIKINY